MREYRMKDSKGEIRTMVEIGRKNDTKFSILRDDASEAELRGTNTAIMTKRSASGAHNHGF